MGATPYSVLFVHDKFGLKWNLEIFKTFQPSGERYTQVTKINNCLFTN